jgi:hypothetical protein
VRWLPLTALAVAALVASAAAWACADPEPEPQPGTTLTDIEGGPVDDVFVADCDAAIAPAQIDPDEPRRVAVIGAIDSVSEADVAGVDTVLEFADTDAAIAILDDARDRHPEDLEGAYESQTVCVRGVVRTVLDQPVIAAAASEDIAILGGDRNDESERQRR